MKKLLIVFCIILMVIQFLGAQESQQLVYHLVILDRTNAPNANMDSGDMINMLYSYRHETNGYLISLYTSWERPVFPVTHHSMGITSSVVSTRRDTIREYIESDVFRSFLNNTTVTRDLLQALMIPVPPRQPPVSAATIPLTDFREIAYLSIKVGETRSLRDMTADYTVDRWISSTPLSISVDQNGNIFGLRIGNGFIRINEVEYISVAVVPSDEFFLLPDSQVTMLPEDNRSSNTNINEYKTEPTFRLAYRFNNKGENKGASGGNGGIDILGRGPGYTWLWTTFYQGGWFYDLNGVMREMINGIQRDAGNGVELIVKPEFVYLNGVPYLQLRHILRNPGNTAVTNQRFGASADVMIHDNDYAPLVLKPYGAYMTDDENNPSLELMFICLSEDGITPVHTLWLGTYDEGHLDFIYEDRRMDVRGFDSALGFSYQNIDLAPREEKEFIVRFTLVRTE